MPADLLRRVTGIEVEAGVLAIQPGTLRMEVTHNSGELYARLLGGGDAYWDTSEVRALRFD